MSHTPGPWNVQLGDPTDCTWEINSTGARWAAVANVNANTNGSLPVDDETAEANARLIAAAPTLLEELENVLDGGNRANAIAICHRLRNPS